MRKLVFNSGVLSIGSYVSAGASALTYLIAARVFGPSQFGFLASCIGIAVFVVGIADFGVNGWAIRALARGSGSGIFRETLAAKLFIACGLAALWAVASLAILRDPQIAPAGAILSLYVLFAVIGGTVLVPFRAAESMGVVSVAMAVDKTVALTTCLILFAFARKPQALSIALACGAAASMLVGLALIPRDMIKLRLPSAGSIVSIWRSSYSFGLVAASAQILRADVAIVQGAAGPYAAGIYAAPSRLTTLLSVIPTAFSTAVFPRLARPSAQSRQNEMWAAIGMMLLMACVLAVCAVASPWLVRTTLGGSYMSAVWILRIFLAAVLVNAANQPLLALLQANGDERYAGRVVVSAVATGLIVIAVAARQFGSTGAAVGAVYIQLVQLVLFAVRAATGHRTGQRGGVAFPIQASAPLRAGDARSD